MSMNHYTNKSGYNAISSQVEWLFKASEPPAKHPKGAYFTNLGIDAPNLAKRLRIPKEKIEYYFSFVDVGDLKPLKGGRGKYIFYSEDDYTVGPERQIGKGETGL